MHYNTTITQPTIKLCNLYWHFICINSQQLAVEKVVIEKNGASEVFYQNKEMLSFYNPFKIIYDGDVISMVSFKDSDSIWAKNFKRAIASALQIQGDKIGAYVEKEVYTHTYTLTHMLNI